MSAASKEVAESTRAEPWVPFALSLLVLTVLGLIVLGSRPGGALPIWIYSVGMLALGMTAALSLAIALAWSVFRRPVLQRRRLAGLLALAGTLWITSFPLAYPSSHEGHPSRVTFRLPFEGEWFVRDGGDERSDNTLVLAPATRFGWRFVPAVSPSSGEAPGRVVAPADGVVVRVGPSFWVARVAEGQFVVLEGVERSEAEASVWTEGSAVRAGEPLGTVRAGPAGLVLYVTDRDEPRTGEGIPLLFSGVFADGRPRLDSNPARGQRVRAEIPSPESASSR